MTSIRRADLYGAEASSITSSPWPDRIGKKVVTTEYFATRTLLDECFKASGAEPIVVAEMSTIAPMLGLVLRMQIAAIAATNAVPAAMKCLRMIPLESPTPIRTPGRYRRARQLPLADRQASR